MPTRGSMGIPHRQSDWNEMMGSRGHVATEEYIAKRDAIPQFGATKMTRLDLSLTNTTLYAGCEISEVAGRLNLTTPVPDAVQIVGRNVAAWVRDLPASDRTEIVLTGPMAVWSYLIAFHAVVHCFSRVYYDDGRTGRVLVAAHG